MTRSSLALASAALVGAIAGCSNAPAPAGSPDGAVGGSDAAMGGAAACSGKQTPQTDATWTIAADATSRSAKVHVPASYDPTKATPIVIDLHGLASSGSDQARVSNIIAASDADGFIAILPEGTGTPSGWNGGACCAPASSSGIDDTAFIAAVIDRAESDLCVDADRVFATGFSNGGFLAHRLGCELSDRIAAIGAVSGVLGISTCNPVRPMPVLHVHGTADLVIPYDGGGINNNISVADTISGWETRNGCTGDAQTVYQHGDATCVVHGGCAAGADVELCTIDGGGHQWPGGQSSGILNGTLSTDLDATSAIWAFFAAHPRPRAP